MSDLQYNFVDNNFTVYESAPDVEEVYYESPLLEPINISSWAKGISPETGIPIAKDVINEPIQKKSSIIMNNNEEIQTPVNNEKSQDYKVNQKIGNRQKQAVEFFKSKFKDILKWDEKDAIKAAAAITGNLMVESGDKNLIKTDAIGDKHLGPEGSSYGLAQWRLDRRTNLKNFAAKNGKPMSDFYIQLEFLWDEIIKDRQFKILDGLKQAKSVNEATENFMNRFERPNSDPKINLIKTRKSYANSLLS